MSDIKNGKLLSQLIESLKKTGKTKDSSLTAEKFVIAVIDKVKNGSDDSRDRETEELCQVFSKYITDPVKAEDSLLAYINKAARVAFLDELYMKKRFFEAFAAAEREHRNEISAAELFLCIVRKPSEAILQILNIPTDNENEASAENKAEAFKAYSDETEQRFEEFFCNTVQASVFSDSPDIRSEAAYAKKQISLMAKTKMSSLVEDIKRIRSALQASVYGQDNAINVFVTGYFRANMLSMIDKSIRQPGATFLFAGPPGVGKTFLAEKAAEVLNLPFMRFDMSEYADKESGLEFCGSDNVYKNSKKGNVTSFVEENPKCVLLFDEIEKAHISVIHLFLQILDAGRVRDRFNDKEVSFRDAIIILTTNVGKQLYEESESGDFSYLPRKVIIKALQNDINPVTGAPYFPEAICSRFSSGNVVMFNHIDAHNLCVIAKKEIERNAENLEKETGIKIKIDEQVYSALLFSEGSAADARNVRSRAEAFFNDELYELLRLIASKKVRTNIDNIEKIQVSVDLSQSGNEICNLFISERKTQVLIFANPDTVSMCKEKLDNFEIFSAQNLRTAIDIMKAKNIDFVMINMKCGVTSATSESLNIEDSQSPAREFFKFLKEQRKGLPVYLIEDRSTSLSEEEKDSFARQGVRGVLRVSKGKSSFKKEVSLIAASLHQQAGMIKLAKENKLISFETAQRISKNGKSAEIKLFDFKPAVAVDSRDAKNILSSVSKPDVCFDDVIGALEAKKELADFAEYLKKPEKYIGTGVKAPKGILLYGPSGTGKTMLAKAMANETGVTFIAAEGNGFLKKYVGEGSEKVHSLFKIARKYAPSILFIDEIDAIAKERKGGVNAAANGEEILTAFLTEMDGFSSDPTRPVFVLAATNFDVEQGSEKRLDKALLRRFDRRVYIGLPDKQARTMFLAKKIENNSVFDISEGQLENIAIRSMGMSFAEIDSVVELALRSAIREGSSKVTDDVFEEAFETFNNGEVTHWDVSQLERIARHEAGHAVVCFSSGEMPSYLTIVSRNKHGGYMQHAEREGKAIYTKDELLAGIRTLLAGRAAEIVYYGERDGISTGAIGDLSAATNLAQQIICTYGMDDEFGLAFVNGAVAANGDMSVEVRAVVNRILKEQMNEAVRIISENKAKTDSLVRELLNKNHLNEAEISKILSKENLSDKI